MNGREEWGEAKWKEKWRGVKDGKEEIWRLGDKVRGMKRRKEEEKRRGIGKVTRNGWKGNWRWWELK